MKNSGNAIGTIIMLVIGLFFLVKGMGVVIQDFQTGIDYNTMTEAQVTEGTLVEGQIFYVMDYFEEETLSRRGRSTGITLSRMYFIPMDNKYMAIRVDGTQCSRMDEMVEDTWNYIDGYVEQVSTVFAMKGKIKAFDSQDRKYAYDYLREALQVSTDAECDAYLIPYYIDCRYYGKAYIPLGIAAFFLFFVGMDIRKWKKSKEVVYTSYDDNSSYNNTSYTEDAYETPMSEEPKDPGMREDPFEAARREQVAATMETAPDDISAEPQIASTETNSESTFRLKLKEDE